MKLAPVLVLALAVAAGSALAQRTPASAKTTEQQARSYILSAFMTGAAPLIISDDVRVAPELREQLGLPADADSRTVYQDLLRLIGGKPLNVRPAIRDEIARAQARAEPDKPCFAIEAGNELLLVQYDLERDDIIFVAQPSLVAAARPAEKKPEASAPSPAPAAATEAVKPAPAPEPVPLTEIKPAPAPSGQVVEPQVPRAAVSAKPLPPTPPAAARPPALKPTGPCVIKPVMTDQDLVNCGATPR